MRCFSMGNSISQACVTPFWIMEGIWCPSIVTTDESEDFTDLSLYVFFNESENSSCCKCLNIARHINTLPVYGYFVLRVLLNSKN